MRIRETKVKQRAEDYSVTRLQSGYSKMEKTTQQKEENEMMYLSTDKCETCLNRTNCPYKAKYDQSVNALKNFLMENKNVDFYGRLRAQCDYYFHDQSDDMKVCDCQG